MTSERSKRRDFLSLIFIAKSISKKLLINADIARFIYWLEDSVASARAVKPCC